MLTEQLCQTAPFTYKKSQSEFQGFTLHLADYYHFNETDNKASALSC